MNYVPNSDMVNRRLWEMIEDGTIDPNTLKIKHKGKAEDHCDAIIEILKKMEGKNES